MIPARNLTNDNWRDRLGLDDPERCLLVAVIRLALRDILSGSPHLAADARRYLYGDNFTADCALLDIDPTRVRRLLLEHPNMKRLLAREQIQQAHADYLDPARNLTLEQVAAAYNVSPATLSRYFSQEHLSVRPHRPPRGRPAAGSNLEALQELNRVLTRLSDLPAAGTVRLHIDIELTLNEATPS